MYGSTGDGTGSGFDQLLREVVQEPGMLAPTTSLMDERFVIKRALGSGGMGVVYEATDRERDAGVALKLLTSVDASGIYRLKQEFRALADVVHQNLVALYELFCDREHWFFTMELLQGRTLFDPAGEELGGQRLRSVFAQLAAGIRAIHDAGKLHRDLKPSNVMLTPEGRVVILDFGLASDQAPGGAGQTIVDGGVTGTPLYMAPEQAAAEPATPSSDWYAFGAMLFEALTGRPPFADRARAVLLSKLQQDAPRPSSVNRDVPGDIDQLCFRLLQREPGARPAPQQITEVLGPAAVTARTDSLPPPEGIPFVGRVAELEALEAAFAATDQGRTVAVFVHGVSGVGKTALVEQFLAGIQQQGKAVVLSGRCYQRESVPYKTCDSLIDALSRYLRRMPPERAANLLPRHVHAVARLFPALRRLDFIKQFKQRHPLPPDPDELRRVAFEAFKELLANIAAQDPLILFVDNLQWSDLDGAKLLSSVLSRPDPPSLLLIGAYRSEEVDVGGGLSGLRKRIVELGAAEVREIALGELSPQDSQKLARELLPVSIRDRAAQIAQEARGSPFFITELSFFTSRAQDPEEKVRLQDAIQGRLSMLGHGEREVLEAICVSARPIEQALLQKIIGRNDVATALRRLQAERLVRAVTSGRASEVRAYHDRIRESVIAGLDRAGLARWHGRLARSMQAFERTDLIALTEHLLGAGEDLEAGACASRAADHALETLAFENAARLYRIALDLNPGDRHSQRALQIRLGTALASAGRGAEAAQAFMQAAESASPEQELELRQLAANEWIMTGHMTEGMRELDRVLRTVGLRLLTRPIASIISVLIHRFLIMLHGLKFKERPASELSGKQLLELRACMTAAKGLYCADPLQAAAYSSRFLWLALRSGVVSQIIVGLASEAMYWAAESVSHRLRVEKYLELARQLGQAVKDPESRAHLQFATGAAAYMLGDMSRAKEHLERAEKICIEECSGVAWLLSIARNFLGMAYSNLGRLRELQKHWDTWVKYGQERDDLNLLVWQRVATLGVFRYLAVDQVEMAREQMAQGLEKWPGQGFDVFRWAADLSELMIEVYVGNRRRAFEIARGVSKRLSRSRLFLNQFLRVHTRVYLAIAALGAASNTQDRKPLLRIARRQLKKLVREKYPVVEPWIFYIKGCFARLEGDEDGAVKMLREAAKAFGQGGFALYAAATRRQLGLLLDGDEGRRLVAEADETLKREGILRPDRLAATLAPGFPD